jgi:hypothetical protein
LSSDKTYYYKVFSKDSAGGLSNDQGGSGTVSKQPTGKYITPPELYDSTISVATSANSATVSWVTNRSSDSFVVYGTNENLGSSFGTRDNTTEHNVTITGLTAGTKYYYKVQSLDPGDYRDYSESAGYSDIKEFSTAASPTLSNVAFSDITTTSAIVSFETNKPSTTKIEYGITTDYGTEITNTTTGATQHLARLANLQEGTTYQVKITFTDEEGTVISSPGHAFATLEMPRVESFNVETIADRASTSVRISFLTNVDTIGAVSYGKDSSSDNEVASSEYKKVHEYEVADLEDSQTYIFQAIVRDQFGNEVTSESNSYTTPVDSRPPKVTDVTIEASNVGTGKEDEAQIAISWKTDEVATSYVEYGIGISGDNYSGKTAEDPTSTNSHLVIVSGLVDSTPYHLRACSKDKGGNLTCSDDNTVIPGEVSKSILSILLNALKNAFGWLEVLVR